MPASRVRRRLWTAWKKGRLNGVCRIRSVSGSLNITCTWRVEEARGDPVPGAVDDLVAVEARAHLDDATGLDDHVTGARVSRRAVVERATGEDGVLVMRRR